MYIIPQPQKLKRTEGTCFIDYDRKIVLDSSCGPELFSYAALLSKEMEASAGYGLAVTKGGSQRTAVRISLDEGLPREGYRLRVTEEGIVLAGGSGAGVLYGVQTLRQVIRQCGAAVPCMEIEDFPQIPARGLYYDVTRGRIPTLEYLKKLADRMAFYKMNQLQLYIEHSFLFENLSEVWRDDTPLTAEEILELDAYCRERQIELVPSLSSFGHLYKVLRTKSFSHLCELPNSAEQPFGLIDRMRHHTLDVSNPESIQFAKAMIEQYLPLFTSRHFNIGADETFDLGRGRSKKLADEIGVQGLYMDFVKQLCTFVVEKGKIPMFWGDIICEFPEAVRELPKETICLNWGYERDVSEESSRKLAEAGAVQYSCPGVSGWNQMVNRLDIAYENIRRMCTYAVKYGSVGVLTTDWGDFGHINHPDFGVPAMIYGAAFSWNSQIPTFDVINRQISRVEYGDAIELLVSLMAEVSMHQVFGWWDLVWLKERGDWKLDWERLKTIPEENWILDELRRQLTELAPSLASESRGILRACLIAIRGIQLIQRAGRTFGIRRYRPEGEHMEEGSRLAAELETWFYDYGQLWRSVSRESELAHIRDVICWCADALR